MDSPARTHWRLGTIGFSYDEWDGVVYPKGAPSHRRLPIYAQQFDTVEIDATFYALPRVEIVRRWADATPEHFRFSIKAPREVTHEGSLILPTSRDAMARFLDLIRELGDKLGVVLLQFPPHFRNEGQQRINLELFLRNLPKDIAYAVELRNDSWWTRDAAEMFRLLSTRFGMRLAWVGADQPTEALANVSPADPSGVGRACHPRLIYPVDDFLYLRWVGNHGQFPQQREEQVDPTPRLRWWAERLQQRLAASPDIREVWGFFGNSYAGHAPATLRRFAHLMGLPTVAEDATPAGRQGKLF